MELYEMRCSGFSTLEFFSRVLSLESRVAEPICSFPKATGEPLAAKALRRGKKDVIFLHREVYQKWKTGFQRFFERRFSDVFSYGNCRKLSETCEISLLCS